MYIHVYTYACTYKYTCTCIHVLVMYILRTLFLRISKYNNITHHDDL